jgi:tetratricopeptide (TPR) repeat protein
VGEFIAKGITGGMDGGDQEIEPQPFYSVAEAARRHTDFEKAARLVREQLDQFPGDFPGTMLLASIQAENLHDLPAAEATLENWMQGPAATLTGISSALTAVADWQLQFAQDPEAARAALQRIVDKMPDTQLAHRAAQRLAHLPTAEHLASLRAGPAKDLPPGEKNIGLRKSYTPPPPGDPEAMVEEYVQQLQQHPADTATREKLAVLYAEHFERLDLAVDQIEQLIQLPNETPRHIALWLNLVADLQIRFGRNVPAAEAALRRIQEMYPNTALADATVERLAALQRETHANRVPALKKIGHYDKNIGLKRREAEDRR